MEEEKQKMERTIEVKIEKGDVEVNNIEKGKEKIPKKHFPLFLMFSPLSFKFENQIKIQVVCFIWHLYLNVFIDYTAEDSLLDSSLLQLRFFGDLTSY